MWKDSITAFDNGAIAPRGSESNSLNIPSDLSAMVRRNEGLVKNMQSNFDRNFDCNYKSDHYGYFDAINNCAGQAR